MISNREIFRENQSACHIHKQLLQADADELVADRLQTKNIPFLLEINHKSKTEQVNL